MLHSLWYLALYSVHRHSHLHRAGFPGILRAEFHVAHLIAVPSALHPGGHDRGCIRECVLLYRPVGEHDVPCDKSLLQHRDCDVDTPALHNRVLRDQLQEVPVLPE